MYGLIVGDQYLEEILSVINKEDIWFQKSGEFSSESFLQYCQSAANANIQTLILDMDCTDPSSLIKGVRQYRYMRGNSRIICIAEGKQVGDPTVAALVSLGVYDILAPSPGDENEDEEEELSIAPFIKTALLKPSSYADAARWHVDLEAAILPEPIKKDRKEKWGPVKVEQKVIEIEVSRYQVFPNQLVVIGSMYPGAGSTWISCLLARLIHYLDVPNAVFENPINVPELYVLLNGDVYAPKDYVSKPKQIFQQGMITQNTEWTLGLTEWIPCHPEAILEWRYENTLKLLYSIKKPIVLVDVSHHWEHQSVQELCKDADEIVFVLDPFPHKFQRKDTEHHVRWLQELKSAGKSVNIVANKDLQISGRNEWIHSMPIPPTCYFPFLDPKTIVQTAWEGVLPTERQELREKLMEACFPLLRRLIPDNYLSKPVHKTKKRLFNWFSIR